jgi:hypothetical protein
VSLAAELEGGILGWPVQPSAERQDYLAEVWGEPMANRFDQQRDLMRDSMRHVAAAYLKPAETVQSVFPAQTSSGIATLLAPGPAGIGIIGGLFGLKNRNRIFVVTDQRILVLDAGWMPPHGALEMRSVNRARGVVAELPRSTCLGPPSIPST